MPALENMVQVDEVLGKVTILTRSRSKIVIDDPNRTLSIQDFNGNRIEMTADGITITSAKDIIMDAPGKILLKAVGPIQSQSTGGDVTQSGMNISQTAQMKYSAQGAASAEVTAAGELKIKGSMVMIN